MLASVIICTHNPKSEFLNRTLQALAKQTLALSQWELIIIDNSSDKPVAENFEVPWHPKCKFICEETLGLTAARIRGIEESRGDLIVFVDDDNCLKENYLKLLMDTMESMPLLGVLGSGRISPEFEREPTVTELPFLRSLALRDEQRSYFSNDVSYTKAIPFGAGVCIRRLFALQYVHSCTTRPLAFSLDRSGEQLLSGGDIDLALHACREGYLSGILPELEVTHLIPRARLDHDYLVRIAAGHAASSYILSKLWQFEKHPENPLIRWGRYWKKRMLAKGLERRILIGEYKAEQSARKTWSTIQT